MTSAQGERYALAAQEDRSAPRARLSIPASLRPSGARGFQTVVRDLSLSGYSATAITRIPVGTICWLTLPERETLPGRAIWWDNGLVGCAFDALLEIDDVEAILDRWRGKSALRSQP